jgi:hypothetical protein
MTTEMPDSGLTRRKLLTAQWRYVAMLSYEIDPEVLRPLVPRGTQLDYFDGKTYVSMVGFLFLDAKLLGVPVPLHRNFEEVNLRYYVKRDEAGETRRGVAFIRELVPRWAIAKIARWIYNEPYCATAMRHRLDADAVELCTPSETDMDKLGQPTVCYEWRWEGTWNRLQLRGLGSARPLVPGSREQFFAEHFFGYCPQRDGGTIEYQVEHPSWHVWPGAAAELDCNVAQLYGSQFVEALVRPAASSLLAYGSTVSVYRPKRIC